MNVPSSDAKALVEEIVESINDIKMLMFSYVRYSHKYNIIILIKIMISA